MNRISTYVGVMVFVLMVFGGAVSAQTTTTVVGVVRNANTELPVQNATVTINPGNIQQTTDITGTFSFEGLEYGDYGVAVTAPGFHSASRSVTLEYLFFPMDFSLAPISGDGPSTMIGLVYNSETGFPVAQANITVEPGPHTALTNLSGTFSVTGLAAGEYTVTVDAEGFQSSTLSIIVAEPVHPVEFPLQSSDGGGRGSIMGVVRDMISRFPVSGARVNLNPGGLSTDTDDTGAFMFSNLEYRSYTLSISAPGYESFQKSVELDIPIMPQDLLLTSSGDPATTGGLAGFVRNGSNSLPISGAQVTLSPGDHSTTTGVTGAYSFTGLAYESYTLNVVAEGFEPFQSVYAVRSASNSFDVILLPVGSAGDGEGEGEGEGEGDGEARTDGCALFSCLGSNDEEESGTKMLSDLLLIGMALLGLAALGGMRRG